MRFLRPLGMALLGLSLVCCNKPPKESLSIGTISGPEAELVETAKEVALKKYGLTIKIIEFNDYNLPNESLQDGSLDANVYQHLPYLSSAMKAHGYDFEIIGKTFVYPAALYSSKVKTLADIKEGAVIAIPNDPSNEARALLLLSKAGLLTLKQSTKATLADIQDNPKKLQLKELDAAQLPRVLPDVDAAVINTTFALPAGLDPTRDAIFREGKNSPYANLIVIKKNALKKTQLIEFVKAFQSKEVKERAQGLFGDAAIAAW